VASPTAYRSATVSVSGCFVDEPDQKERGAGEKHVGPQTVITGLAEGRFAGPIDRHGERLADAGRSRRPTGAKRLTVKAGAWRGRSRRR